MNDLVSVIVPVYNVEKYLQRCVESITKQTYKNLEIILVDDGSTDCSKHLCDKFKLYDDRIKVIHKQNGGLSSARNAGIDVATGDFITFVDSDDFVANEMIENMMSIVEQNNADIVICNRYHYYENDKKYIKYNILDNDLVMNSEQAIYEMNSYRNFDMSACGKLYRINIFDEIRFPIGKINEDYYVMYLILDKAKKIVYNSMPYYYYFQRSGSISKTATLKYDYVYAAYEQMKYVEKKYPRLKACVHVAYLSANMTIYNTLLKCGAKCTKEELQQLRNNVKKQYMYINEYNDLPILRRIQTILFMKCIPLYNLSFKCLNFVKKIKLQMI